MHLFAPLTTRKPCETGWLKKKHSDYCLEDLPDDILILILSSCQINDLLSFRSANKRFHGLIAEYPKVIIPAVAHQTFPNCHHLLTSPLTPAKDTTPKDTRAKETSPKAIEHTLQWLKSRIPLHLAAILVDRHRFAHSWAAGRYGIPAEDPYGDELRGRIANGWRVLQKLSLISQEVHELKPKDVLPNNLNSLAIDLVHPWGFKNRVFIEKELLIERRRTNYIAALPNEMARDYRLMFTLLSSVFRASLENVGNEFQPWVFDWGRGLDAPRLLRRGSSWLTWYILHEGPSLFLQQWWLLPASARHTKNYIRDRAMEEWFGSKTALQTWVGTSTVVPSVQKPWVDVNAQQHNIQRNHATVIQSRMAKKAAAAGDWLPIGPIRVFGQYAEHRQREAEKGNLPPEEILEHVPFQIEFRCPEELVERANQLNQGQDIARQRRQSFQRMASSLRT